MIWVSGAVSALLLVLTAFLEEAAAWYNRLALDLLEGNDDEEEAAEREAQRARQSRLLARFTLAGAFTVGFLGLRERGEAGPILLGVALTGSLLAASMSAARRRSPVGLVGRALHAPLEGPGRFLAWTVAALARLIGLGAPVGALDRLAELDQERRWVRGRSEEDERARMLAALHEFGESLVEDVMVPREEIVGIPAGATLAGTAAVLERERYARYPVYDGSLDAVVGILHVTDLLGAPEGATAASMAREPLFTNATKPVGTLLRELQGSGNRMALVVDEYGGTAGMVTVEDLLEELVGEMEDADENEEEGLREDGVWLEVAAAEPHRINAVRLILADGNRRGHPEEK